MFSGGVGSWATAKRVVERHGTEGVVLLFADTKMEDEDLYRFIDEAAANLGVPLVKIADGRTPWELFFQGRVIGNGKVDPCSSKLKRDLMDKWRKAHCTPEETTIYIGIDWHEIHRLHNAQKRCAPWRYEAPMCEPPYLTKVEMLESLKAEGIEPPKLYKLGFPHNNCGGFCVKAGQGQFALLLRTMPERYRWHEEQEERVRQEQIAHGVKPSTVLYHRRGVKGKGRIRVTMREFREQMERRDAVQPEISQCGGCGCALD